MIEVYDPPFKNVKRNDYGEGGDLFYECQDRERKNCFIPTKKKCFPKCIPFLTGKLSYEDYIEFLIGFSGKRTIMIEARFKAFYKKVERDTVFFNGKEISHRSIKRRIKCLYL